MNYVRIILFCVVAAIVYGIIHDNITARICLEYFTIGHPAIFGTDSPTLLGIGWGIVATWWVGLLLGVPLAFAAQSGVLPKRSPHSLVRPVLILLFVMGCCAALAGFIGFLAAVAHLVYLVPPFDTMVPASRQVPFLTAMWIHSASYLVGFVGGVILIVRTWRSRNQNRFLCYIIKITQRFEIEC